MQWKALSVCVLVVALGANAVGCGDDDESSGDAPSPAVAASSISKDEFVEQANAICKPGRAKLLSAVLAYQKKHLNEPSVKVVVDTARKVIDPELQRQVEELRELGAPSGDVEEVEKVLASLQNSAGEIVEKKPPTFNEAQVFLQLAGKDASRYGLDECQYVLVDEDFNSRVLNSG